MSDRLEIIVNPNAAGGRGGRVLPELEQRLRQSSIRFSTTSTRGPGDARRLAAAACRRGTPRLLVVGGDGTLHEVVNGFPERGEWPAVAILPVGTGNDFHRMLRAPAEVSGVLGLLATGYRRTLDLGQVRWKGGEARFVNLLGVGVDVEVLRRRDRFARLPGLFQYGAALLSAAAGYEHLPLELEWEDGSGTCGRRSTRTLLTAVTVGPSIGGGFILSPEARPDDGLLDLFVVDDLGLAGVVRHLPRVFRGTHASIPQIHSAQLRSGRIRSADGRPLRFELDGELMPDPSPWLEIEIEPARFPVLEVPE